MQNHPTNEAESDEKLDLYRKDKNTRKTLNYFWQRKREQVESFSRHFFIITDKIE